MESNQTSGTKSETLCKVCGDKASGKHYGVSSCDGCRGFFKRSIRRNLEYVCKENGRCIVDVTRRNQCQACRFRKCLQVNMKKDGCHLGSVKISRGELSFSENRNVKQTYYDNIPAVQHERAPRSSHHSLHHYAGPLGSRLRSIHGGTSLFAGLPLHLPGPPILDPTSSTHNPYLHHSFLYPSMLAGFVKPTTVLPTMSTSSAFTQKIESVQIVSHRSVKDDEVTSSEETQERPAEEEGKRVDIKSGYDGNFRQTIRPVDITSLTVLPTENIYESAAKLLFLSVKWARTIPSFLQLSYRDQSILLEESWSELFILTAAQWALPIDENTLISNAISATTRHLTLEENARKLRDVITRLTILRIDHTEYACLKALVLFKAECRGICDPTHVELLQDQTHVMLHEYCQNRPCTPKGRFGKLLLVLPAIQSISRRGLEELLFRKTIGDVAIERLLGDMVKAANNT